jgi:RNA polymerase sigma-70 factor (ECF subfamily)
MNELTSKLSDADIVTRTLIERSFFAVIVGRYEDKLTRYLCRLGVPNHEDRQDVLQEVFIKVYKNLNAFDGDLSFSSWIYRIARNEAISWYRKQKVRPEGHGVADADELFLYMESEQTSAEKLVESEISSVALMQAIAALPTKYRDPIILRFFEHKEYNEISDILKIPIGTVGTLISRAKKKLSVLYTVAQSTQT